jgi:hypothetical protein
MTNPMGQAATPAAAVAATDAERADEDVVDPTHDGDGVAVGQADVEADKERAEQDREQDR